ncbi:MAG: tyrosine-type recombinase/integrase [Lachnospiraceae bacterium]|nr:tyrosine-type recombinase/integrase [Lachnospiraceae bacterium]
MRHTACTRIAESGMDIKVLQTVMGHKKVDVTMNIYNHADLNRMKKEFQKMESIKAEYMQV